MMDDGPLWMFRIYFRVEAKILKQGKAKGLETSQDQILGEGPYANTQAQALYDKVILPHMPQSSLKYLGQDSRTRKKN